MTEPKKLVATVGCFLTEGCPGVISIPVERRTERGELVIEQKHNEYYGIPCNECGERVSVSSLRIGVFKG